MKDIINQIKQRLQSPDIETYNTLNDKKKSILLNIFFFLMLGMLLFFIIFSIARNDQQHIIIDSSVFTILVVLYILFKRKKQLLIVSHLFVSILGSIAYFYVLTGGVDNTGLIFIVLLPLPFVLLLGRKPGTVVLFVFFLACLFASNFLTHLDWVTTYEFDYSLRIYVCFLIITFLAYLNESVFDIIYSRLKKTTDSLQTSREQYKALSINREKFLSIISHDLKNQIASFNSATEILKTNYQNLKESEKQDIIEMLSESSKKNVRLLQDLLKWSMMKNESFPHNPVPIKLERVYREVIALFDAEIDKKDISIFLKLKSNSEVIADYDMLSAIMRNLFSNALKFSKAKGKIKIISEEEEEHMRIVIEDDGKGMDQATLKNIQDSMSTTSDEPDNEFGSGIGLLLVKEFIEWNKGTLSIESAVNVGTVISFTLPLVE